MTKSRYLLQLRTTVAFAGLAFSIPAMANAQSNSAPAAADEQAATEADEIVVTAQRREQGVQTVPIAIQALSGATLADRGVRGPQDLGQFTPNVNISSPAGAGSQPSITIRGIGLNDFNTNNAGPNGVYVDEFYVSAPSAQGVSMFDLDRVEVLKGPQGTLYGRNTSGGAINLISAKPTFDFSAKLRGEYSSYNTVNLEGAIGGGLTETLAARLSGVFNSSDGYVTNLLRNRKENGANNFALRGQLLWQPDPGLKVNAKVQVARSVALPVRYKLYGTIAPETYDPVAALVLGTAIYCSPERMLSGACIDVFGNQTSAKYYEGSYNRNEKARSTDVQAILRVDYDAGPFEVTSVSGYNFNDRYFPEDTDSSPVRSVELDFGSKSYEFTQELRFSKSESNYSWVAGAYFLSEVIKQDQPLEVLLDLDNLFGPGAGDGAAYIDQTFNRQKTESYAVFGQGEYELLPALRLVLGARYTWENKDFSTTAFTRFQSGGIDSFGPVTNQFAATRKLKQERFNWRAGLNYRITPETMVYTSIATGFKSGGFNGGFLDHNPSVRALQLEPVKPEIVTAYEVGIKSQFLDRKVTLNLAGFYNDYKNQQVNILVSNPDRTKPAFFSLDNAQKARIYGIDADLTVRPFKGLALGAQLGLLNTKLTKFVAALDPSQPDYSGNKLSQAPSTTLSLSGDYKYPVGSGEVSLHYDASYRSKVFFEPSNSDYVSQAGYWLQNARVSYSFADDRYEVGAFGRNLFNKNYAIYGADLSHPFGFVEHVMGTPRYIGVDFAAKF